MRQIFNDIGLERKFEEDGYVIIPFLNEAEADGLSKFYLSKAIVQDPDGLHSSLLSNDAEFKERAYDNIVEAFESHVSHYFHDYMPILAQFLVKEAGTSEKFNLHLDPALTDESKFTAISIWCALSDIGSANGAMFIKRMGHRHVSFARASGPPIYLPEQIEGDENVDLIELKKGEALIANQKIPHGSMPNNSDQPRIAANLRLIPQEADNMFYFEEPNGNLSVYKVSADYYKYGYVEEKDNRPKENGLIRQIEKETLTSGIAKWHQSLESN